MRSMAARLSVIAAITVLAFLCFRGIAHGQGSFLGGIVTYDPQNNWVLFTDHTGTWHAPLAMTNSKASSNSVVEFTLNTDDQFVLQTYGGGQPTSALDVDVDGSAALYGSAGGGIGVDAATGDTCVPATRDNPCGPTSLRVNSGGIVSSYQGQPTFGHGISTILYAADVSLTGAFGPYAFFTTNASGYGSSGLYRVTGYMTVVSPAPGSTMQVAIGYFDESGKQVQNNGLAIPFETVGETLPFSCVFWSQSQSPITITMNVAGGSPTYTVHVRLEEL